MSRWGCASSATPATSTSVSPSTRCSSPSRRRSLRRSATNSPSSCDKRRSLPTLPPVREQGAGAGEPGQVTPRLGPKPTLRVARAPPAGPAERDPVNEQVPRRQVERRDAWATDPEERRSGRQHGYGRLINDGLRTRVGRDPSETRPAVSETLEFVPR